MAKIHQQPPVPMWPWGGPRSVRERLVETRQLDKKRKAGDPKRPALASTALIDFMGPAHSSEELRLPLPMPPPGHDADVESFLDRPHLQSAARRHEDESRRQLERGFTRISATPERMDRMRALLGREEEMLGLVSQMATEMREILRLMWDAQKDEGY